MTPEQFTYWLMGYFEISNCNDLTDKQVIIIKDHLDLVFKKVTPNRGLTPAQKLYNDIIYPEKEHNRTYC